MKKRFALGGYLRSSMIFVLLCGIALLAGCSRLGGEEKLNDLDFTVVPNNEIQSDVLSLIDEKKENPFQMTYSDGEFKYIVVGYGMKDGGGFSIRVDAVYETETQICVQTTLTGPEDADPKSQEPSYPYIVIRTQNLDKTVTFPEK